MSLLVFVRVGDAKLAKLDQACCKEAFSSLMTLVLEAARTDTDAAGLGFVVPWIQAFTFLLVTLGVLGISL